MEMLLCIGGVWRVILLPIAMYFQEYVSFIQLLTRRWFLFSLLHLKYKKPLKSIVQIRSEGCSRLLWVLQLFTVFCFLGGWDYINSDLHHTLCWKLQSALIYWLVMISVLLFLSSVLFSFFLTTKYPRMCFNWFCLQSAQSWKRKHFMSRVLLQKPFFFLEVCLSRN